MVSLEEAIEPEEERTLKFLPDQRLVWTILCRDCLSLFDRRPIIPPSGLLACGGGLK